MSSPAPRVPPKNAVTSAVTRRLVEIISSLVMFGGGVVIQAYGSTAGPDGTPETLPLLAGGVLVAFGGIALSWIASGILGERQVEDARKDAQISINEKLSYLARVLGQAAGQINQAVEDSESRRISGATGFALVSQANRLIYGQVNEIAVILNEQWDAAHLLETTKALNEVARELGQSRPGTTEVEQIQTKLKGIENQLAAVAPARKFDLVDVECPYCSHINSVRLGDQQGDTAQPVCSSCTLRFYAHRGSSSRVQVRAQPEAASVSVTNASPAVRGYDRRSLTCPSCRQTLTARLDGKGLRTMLCPNCISAVLVDPATGSIALHDRYDSVNPMDFARSGTRPKMRCPSCDRWIKSVVITVRGYAALCEIDYHVLQVSTEEFNEHLAREKAATTR